MSLPTIQENPNGLHGRYVVTKASGEPVDPDAIYFVLRLDSGGDDKEHIAACRLAARCYASQFPFGHPLYQLGNDLRKLVAKMYSQDAKASQP